MTDSNEPGKMESGQEASADDEIIELTEVVSESAETDEPVIELTDIAGDGDEPVIELTDVAEDEDEPVIELTDVAEDEDEPVVELTDAAEDEDEPVIELTDVAVEAVSEAEPVAEDAAENIIELTDAVDAVQKNTEEQREAPETVPGEDSGLGAVFSEATDYEPLPDDDFTDTLGVDLEAGLDPPAPPAISSEDIEAAIERVVKEMLSEKIDVLLRKVIEREVSKEVERIKTLLLDETLGTDGAMDNL